MSDSYELIREKYRPKKVKILLIAESPPPATSVASSRHFYRTDKTRRDDRLFINTMKALYEDAAEMAEAQIEPDKQKWLERFASDGFFMIEALEISQPHEATKKERQEYIRQSLPRLIERVSMLADKSTSIILIKSNVYDVAALPLRDSGFRVLNTELLDYPGRYNQAAYREKLARLLSSSK